MESKIATLSPDVVTVTSEERPTPKPVRMSFSDVMAQSAGTIVGGAESAVAVLPGTSMTALAVRGGAAGVTAPPLGPPLGMGLPLGGIGAPIGGVPAPVLPTPGVPTPGFSYGGMGGVGAALAEGPGATPSASFGGQFLASVAASADGGAAASLQQSEQSNLYYLQLQQQVAQQSQAFETLSNVLKSESDTVKNAISNMH